MVLAIFVTEGLVKHQLDLSEVGFEPTPPFGDQNPQQRKQTLESGALDHSAILTPVHTLKTTYD